MINSPVALCDLRKKAERSANKLKPEIITGSRWLAYRGNFIVVVVFTVEVAIDNIEIFPLPRRLPEHDLVSSVMLASAAQEVYQRTWNNNFSYPTKTISNNAKKSTTKDKLLKIKKKMKINKLSFAKTEKKIKVYIQVLAWGISTGEKWGRINRW